MFKKIIFFFTIIIIAIIFIQNIDKKEVEATKTTEETLIPKQIEIKDRVTHIEITEQSTYGYLMKEAGIDYNDYTAIYEAAQPLYDLVKIRLGKFIDLTFDKDTDNLKRLSYKIDSEDQLIVDKNEKKNASSSDVEFIWEARIEAIPYEVRIKQSEGKIESSLYEAALEKEIDIRSIIELANAFQWSIDFAMDPRVGDTFKFIYEERYLDGEYIMPGKVLAGIYINDGAKYELFYFEEDEENKGYFDAEGNSVQKMFLKSPVEFKYISSGYTTGARKVMEFKLSGPHLAIDYAASQGTPIRSVGDGTIAFAGWKTGYGYITSVRHNGTYSTNYAHQSKIAVKYGQKVKQGQTIGYVGSTGYSTGPHLHYEMIKNGAKVNPQKEVLPPGKSIKEENKERFFDSIKDWKEKLEK